MKTVDIFIDSEVPSEQSVFKVPHDASEHQSPAVTAAPVPKKCKCLLEAPSMSVSIGIYSALTLASELVS